MKPVKEVSNVAMESVVMSSDGKQRVPLYLVYGVEHMILGTHIYRIPVLPPAIIEDVRVIPFFSILSCLSSGN